jgi:ClpP class serine protease
MRPMPSLDLQPFAMTAEGLEALKADYRVAHARMLAGDLSPDDGAPAGYELQGDVAVVTVRGPLLRYDNLLSWLFGYTTYEGIEAAVTAALDDYGVKSILLVVNSPGGLADGVGELADFIDAASAKKPLWVYAEGCCASAAYWISSQANRIVAYDTALVGCIGTRTTRVDFSKAEEMAGLKVYDLVSEQSPMKRDYPVDKQVLAKVQTMLNDNAAIFIRTVARGRRVDEDTVINDFGRGDCLVAEKALAAGSIDEVSNFTSTLAALTSSATTAPTGARTMTMKNPDPAAPAAGPTSSAAPPAVAGGAEWKCEGCNEMMGPSAKAFCSKCAEDEDEDEDDEESKAAKAFMSKALALAGVTDADQCLALIKSGREAMAAQQVAEEKAKADAKAKANTDARAAIEGAVASGKILPGQVAGLADFLDSDEAAGALRAGAEGIVDAATLTAALGKVEFSAKDAKRISAYVGTKASALPTGHREPPSTEQNVLAAAITEEQARKFGLDPKRAAALINVNSVADIPHATGASAEKKGA